MSLCVMAMNLLQWPHTGEVVMLPQFLWSLIIFSANTSPCLKLPAKIFSGVFASVCALFIAHFSPLIELADTLPTILSGTVVYIVFHYYASKLSYSEMMSAHTASIILAGSIAYHISYELFRMMQQPGYAKEGGYSILKAGFFASIGLAAAGAFREQVDIKKTLEVLVKKRTREIVNQAGQLRMVELALQASETAIAIADSSCREGCSSSIIWSNPAFDNLNCEVEGRISKECLLHALQPAFQKAFKAAEEHSAASSNESTSSSDTNISASEDAVVSETKSDAAACVDLKIKVGDSTFLVDVSLFPASDDRINKLLGDDSGKKKNPSDDSSQESGASMRYLVALKDVTAQLAREQAEQVAQKEAMLKQAMRESMETLSHELRTPLQGIMGMASLILDDRESTIADCKDAMSMVMVSSRLLLTLINNLLDLRKCDAEMMNEFQLGPLPLSSSLMDAANFCRPFASLNNVRLTLACDFDDLDGSIVKVQSNALRFQQVVVNLVSNAIKYSRAGGTVKLATKVMTLREAEAQISRALAVGVSTEKYAESVGQHQDQVAVISVIDAGPGIPESMAKRVFSKFSQASAAVAGHPNVIGGQSIAQPTGTGLGLNLCMKFVQRMKGNIWASNAPDGGACFSFYLPMMSNGGLSPAAPGLAISTRSGCVAESEPDNLDQYPQHRLPSSLPSLSRWKILVVDDTLINLKVFDRMLRRIGVGRVKTVDSGRKALEALATEDFDMVITDIQMPEMTGLELSEHIQDLSLSIQPILVGLTADTSDSLQDHCSKVGISHVMHKPITAGQIRTFFDQVLDDSIGNHLEDSDL